MLIPNKPGVYAIIVSEYKRNGNQRKLYIGCSATSMEARVASHIWGIKNGKHPCKPMIEAFKRGADFDFVPLIEFEEGEKTKEEILEIEKRMIYALGTDDSRFGYNTNKKSPKQALIS